MSEDKTVDQIREAIAGGLNQDSSSVNNLLSALSKTSLNHMSLLQESIGFFKTLALTETPDEPEEIKELSKEEIIFVTYRSNLFERLRMPVLDSEQLEYLLIRTHELWGEYPTEPKGRWVDWCVWTHLQRRENGVPITEVVAGDKKAKDLKESWIDRHQAREERRKLQKIDNYDRYEGMNDVPDSIHHVIMSPFIEDEDIAEVEIQPDESVSETTQNS